MGCLSSRLFQLLFDAELVAKFKLRDFSRDPLQSNLKLALNYSNITVPATRGEAADQLLDIILKRFAEETNLGDKRSLSPLIVTQSLPGGGKSFFLDCLAALRGRIPGSKWANMELSTHAQRVAKYLDAAIYINIAFNGVQPLGENDTATFAVALRCLHS